MLRQRFRAEFCLGLMECFTLLLRSAGRNRWADGSSDGGAALPDVGTRYLWQRGNRLRSGRVVECLRPVVLTLSEVLLDPPYQVQLRLRCRLEPALRGCVMQLDASYALNGAACLKKRHWQTEIRHYCNHLLCTLERAAQERQVLDQSMRSGQNIGNSSITAVNTTSVSGTPSFK